MNRFGRSLVAGAGVVGGLASSVVLAGAQVVDEPANLDNPVTNTIAPFLGWAKGIALVIVAFGIVYGAVTIVFSHSDAMSGREANGKKVLVACVIAAVILGFGVPMLNSVYSTASDNGGTVTATTEAGG